MNNANIAAATTNPGASAEPLTAEPKAKAEREAEQGVGLPRPGPFVQAVKERGDKWLSAFTPTTTKARPSMSAATWCAMSERGSEWQEALRMSLCETSSDRLFQVERPVYRCGCDGLCPNHPVCPGVIYDKDFSYARRNE